MTSHLAGLIRVQKSDIPRAAEMLTRAFRDYPLLTYAVPDEAQRDHAANYYCQYVLYYGIRNGEAYATSRRMEGIAVLDYVRPVSDDHVAHAAGRSTVRDVRLRKSRRFPPEGSLAVY